MADIKIKNTNSEGKGLRIQHWNGKIPTYDTEQQRAAALAKAVDENGNDEILAGSVQVEPAKEPVDIAKLKKDDLISHVLEMAALAGKEIEIAEDDTKAMIIEKFEALEISLDPAKPEVAGLPKAEQTLVPRYNFANSNLLKEETLSSGEEKMISVTAGFFITIKEEE